MSAQIRSPQTRNKFWGCTIISSANSFPNRELVVYALYLLGGDSRRIQTEDIAIKCLELFPHSFSWTKYPNYPDKDIVRVALTDARKERFGPLVEGRAGQRAGLSKKTSRRPVEDGWMLTAKGVEWILKNLARIETIVGNRQTKEHRQQVLIQLKIIREHPLYKRYAASPDDFCPAIGDLADMLRCRVDAEEEVWLERFKKAELLAKSGAQEEVSDFVKKCRRAYLEQK